jgi:hypothetical protein
MYSAQTTRLKRLTYDFVLYMSRLSEREISCDKTQ